MRRRSQNEYLFAIAFALIVGLFTTVVIWNTATASGESSQALTYPQPIGDFADSASAEPEFTPDGLPAAPGSLPVRDSAPIHITNPSSLPARGEAVPDAPEQIQSPREKQPTQQATSKLDVPWTSTAPVGTIAGVRRSYGRPAPGAAGGFSGGSHPGGSARTTAEPSDSAEEASRAEAQSGSRKHLTVADSAPAEPVANVADTGASDSAPAKSAANVAETGGSNAAPNKSIPNVAETGGSDSAPNKPVANAAVTGGSTPVAESHSGGSSTSTPPVVPPPTLAGAGTPATVFEHTSSPAPDLLMLFDEPDATAQLIANYGDPLVVLAQPDLGPEPLPSSLGATNEPPRVVNPEPATLLLLGTGLCVAAARLRRRRPGHSDLA